MSSMNIDMPKKAKLATSWFGGCSITLCSFNNWWSITPSTILNIPHPNIKPPVKSLPELLMSLRFNNFHNKAMPTNTTTKQKK